LNPRILQTLAQLFAKMFLFLFQVQTKARGMKKRQHSEEQIIAISEQRRSGETTKRFPAQCFRGLDSPKPEL
jgi:hypothetical protein